MNVFNKEQIVLLRNMSLFVYDKFDDAHGVLHGERVVKIAQIIQQKEGGDPSLVEVGAWLHQFHDDLELLKRKTFYLCGEGELFVNSLDAYEKLFHIVDVCRPNKIQNAETIEAKIVYDADALEVVGSYGAIREIYCNTKFRGFDRYEAVQMTMETQKLFSSTIQTGTGRFLCDLAEASMDDFWSSYNKWECLNDIENELG